MKITLPCGRVTLIDDADLPLIAAFNLYSLRYPRSGIVYVICHLKGSRKMKVPLHKLITGYLRTDHINRNGLDNRRCNLRKCSNAQNAQNRGKQRNNSGRFKGVTFWKGKWMAQIGVNGQHIYGGRFNTDVEAARAYDKLAREHHGEFAMVNFPGRGND